MLHLLTFGTRSHKSERQRKREKERRRKVKYAGVDRHHTKKRRWRRKRSANARAWDSVIRFLVTTVSILLLPIGLFHWGYRSAQTRKQEWQGSGHRATTEHTSAQRKQTVSSSSPRTQEVKSSDNTPLSHATQARFGHPEGHTAATATDEINPKSTPKHEPDRYIRKRLTIAGSSYCDPSVLEKLTVGACFDLVAEPDNPHDRNAVMLLWNGRKIGYVPKADNLAFVASLRLKRRLYGVITEINTDTSPTQYEFEVWVDRGEH